MDRALNLATTKASFYLESVRSMYTSSAINFCVISMFLGGVLCYRFNKKGIFWRLPLLIGLILLMCHEICFTAKSRDNYFKLLNMPRSATSSEFSSAVRIAKGKYHPDNLDTGDNDIFIRLNELSKSLSNNYKQRINLYETYGDSYDLTSQYPPTKDEISALAIYRVIEMVANHIMIAMLTVLFYQNSAKRGTFQKAFLLSFLIIALLVDLILDHKFQVEGETEDFDLSEFIRALFKVPHATVPEVIALWRLILVVIISVFYFYGILFQHKEEDILIEKTWRYYLKLHRMIKAGEHQGNKYQPQQDIEEAWKLIDALKPSVEYIRKYSGREKSEGFFKFLNSIFHYVYYGFIAAAIGLNLWYKYEDSIRAWINKKPTFKY